MMLVLLLTTLVTLISLVTSGTVPYPSYPLAVKSPYLSAWLPGNKSLLFPTGQPEFWIGPSATLVWNVMARITPSGGTAKTYTLFGFPVAPSGAQQATQTGPVDLTATRTRVTLTAGMATFELNFMTIIDPANYTIHSLPYSYLAVTASSSAAANIQIFSAIGDSWTGQDGATNIISGTYGTNTTYFFFNNPNQTTFRESREQQAAWGSTAYATQKLSGASLTSNFGPLTSLYTQFINTGNLGRPAASGHSAVGSGVAFSHSLSTVTSPVQVVFAVGSDRAQAINYNQTTQTGYYRATFLTIPPAVDFFLSYYDQALTSMSALDDKITAMGQSVSQNYSDILDACVRQTYGAYEITIPMNLSTQVSKIFEKEISSDGNLNSIDSILPALPLLYLLSPSFIADLMRPVLDFAKGLPGAPPTWTESYILHDIGKSYPSTTPYTKETVKNCRAVKNTLSPEYLPLEVTGGLMILLAAYTQSSGDKSFISNYLGANGKYLLTTYADYLVNNAINPICQLSTVDAITPEANQVQLSVIATIGLGAMGKMTGMTNYTTASKSFAARLLNTSDLGAFTSGATPHFTYYYNHPHTWSVMFPLFADSLLGLNLFQSAYADQSQWYASKFAPSGYGLPYSGNLTTKYNWAITDWNFWGAATSSATLQNMVIDTTHKFMTDGLNDEPWGTKYNVTIPGPGYWLGNRARDTVGANWAIYLLNSL